MIPHNLHICWFGGKAYPKLVQECMNTWKAHLPDYKINLWNETNSPLMHPFVVATLSAKKYAFASDYIRLWALYNYGGVYLDTDMYLLKSIDYLLDNNDVFFGFETENEIYISAGIIGATKGNEFIGSILEEYESLTFDPSKLINFKIPLIITRAYNKFNFKNQVRIYPYDYFYPYPFEKRDSQEHFSSFATENTYAIHLWNLSWRSDYVKIKIILYKFLKRIYNRLNMKRFTI